MTDFKQLTPELLEGLAPNTQIESTHPLFKVVDPVTNKTIICNVWVYEKGTYGPEQHVLITDVSSRSSEYHQLLDAQRSPEPRYGNYIQHLRDGIVKGQGVAVLPKSRVIELLNNKCYTIS
jgi:hypothetical protein